MDITQTETTPRLELPPFQNEKIFPGCDDPQVKDAFPRAIARVRKELGKTYPLFIDGREVVTEEIID